MHRVLSMSGISPYIAASIPEKRGFSTGTSGRDDAEITCFRRPVSRRLISADILHTAE